MKQKVTSAWLVQRGIGKGRDPWAIRKFLGERGLTMAGEARKVNIKPHAAWETVRGIRNDKKFLKHLEALGCPKEFLYGDQNDNERRAV